MFYRLLKNLRSKKQSKSNQRSPQKLNKFWQSPAWKIGIGLSTVVLLITIVLFNKQIDNLLRLWGIKAQNEMGWVTVTVDPNTNDVYPNQAPPANIAEYNLTISPKQEDLWLILLETEGLTRIEIDEINIFHSPGTIDPYIDNMILDNKGTPVNFDFTKNQFDLSGNPIVFSNKDPNPDLPQTFRLTIITKPGTPPLTSDIIGTFDVAVSGTFYEIRTTGEPGIGTVVNYPEGFTLNFLAAGALPDFSLEITSPVDKGQSEIITAGNDANYTITVTAINGFRGIVDLQHTGFTDYMPPIGDAITGVDLPASVDIDDDTPHDVALVVHTNGALKAPIDINFIVAGADVMGNIRTDSGILHIIPAPPAYDFQITATPLPAASYDELLRYVIYPGGRVQYNIAVLRENEWVGVVEADVVWLDEVAAARDIDRVEFDNGGHFTEGSTPELTWLTIYTKTTATPEDLTFYVQGLGDLDGTPPLERRITIELTFSITDFSITLSPLNQTVGDGETADYQVQLTSYNQFNGTIRFSVIPNSPTDYQNYIAAERFDFSDYAWHATDPSPIINLSIDTKAYDPGNPLPYPKDILFRVRATTLVPFVGLGHNTNEATLTITTNPDFTISFTPLPATSDELGRQITYPGGQLTFGVEVRRFNGFIGDVEAYVVWLDKTALIEFDNGGHFNKGSTEEPELALLTVYTKITATCEDLTFYVRGLGDLDGTPPLEERRTRNLTFSIVDFGIVIYGLLPPLYEPNVTVSAGGVAHYNLRITGSNFFNGTIDLSIDPDFAATYPQHIVKNPEFVPVKMIVADQSSPPIPFDIQTQLTSPGTGPSGLPFRIKGINTNRFPVPLERWSNEGTLHIVGLEPGFFLTLTYKDSTSDTVVGITHTAVPYGSITYTVTLSRDNWSGPVTVNANKLLDDYPDAIDSASFANGGHFTGTGDESTDLTINIKSTSPAIDIAFAVVGTDDSGILLPVTSYTALFKIIDYTISLDPPINSIDEGTAGERTYRVIATPQNGYMGLIDLTTDLITGNGIEKITFDNDPARRLDLSLGNPASTVMHVFTNTNIAPPDRNFTVTGTDPNKTTIDGANFFNQGNGTLRVIGPSVDPSFSVDISAAPNYQYPIDPLEPVAYRANPGEWGNFYEVKVTPLDGFGQGTNDTVNLSHPNISVDGVKINAVKFIDKITGGEISQLVFSNNTAPQTVWLYIEVNNTPSNLNPIGFNIIGTSFNYNGHTSTSRLAWLYIDERPNYTIALIPTTNEVNAGNPADYNVIITRDPGYTDDIRLDINNVSSLIGITDYFFTGNNLKTIIVNQFTNTVPLRFTTDATLDHDVIGTTFDVIGSGGSASGEHKATGYLNIRRLLDPTFTIVLHGTNVGDNPDYDVVPGGSATYTVEITPVDKFIGRVNLSHNLTDSYIDLANTGFTNNENYIDFTDPNDPTPKTTKLIVTSTITSQSDHNPIIFIVTGQSLAYGGVGPYSSNNGEFNIVTVSNFYLQLAPNSQMAVRGQTAYYTLSLIRQNGFKDAVNLTSEFDLALINTLVILDGATSVTRFEPDTANQNLSVAVTSFDDANAVDTLFTIKGRDAAGNILEEKSASATLEITNFRIEIREPKNKDVIKGQDVTYTIDLIRENGFDRAIRLGTQFLSTYLHNFDSDPIFGNSGIFPASTLSQMTTLTFSTDIINATLETVPFDVIGADSVDVGFSGQTRQDSGNLNIIDNIPGTPDFTIAITPNSRTVEPGGSTTYTITITRINGHNETIVLSTNLLTDNPNEILQVLFISSLGNPEVTTLTVKTKDTARSSTDPITFTVFGTTLTIVRSDSADLIIYKATDGGGGGGGGGGTVTPPVVPPVIIPPVIEPPIALPSTGPDWLWLISGALMLIGYQLKRNRQ